MTKPTARQIEQAKQILAEHAHGLRSAQALDGWDKPRRGRWDALSVDELTALVAHVESSCGHIRRVVSMIEARDYSQFEAMRLIQAEGQLRDLSESQLKALGNALLKMDEPATGKQRSYLRSLADRHGIDLEEHVSDAGYGSIGELNKWQASHLIFELQQMRTIRLDLDARPKPKRRGWLGRRLAP